MNEVNREFKNRVEEIELYFTFMDSAMHKGVRLISRDQNTQPIDEDLKEILKANSFIMLYNLAESCITDAIENIYHKLKTQNINYNLLRLEIKREVILFLKKNQNVKEFTDNIDNTNDISTDIIYHCFDRQKLLSGNLDAKKIKQLAKKYGFSANITYFEKNNLKINIDSEKLLIVKNRRNNLAHGFQSFKKCGIDYTVQDLIEIKNHVVAYLREILNNIEEYIKNQDYLS